MRKRAAMVHASFRARWQRLGATSPNESLMGSGPFVYIEPDMASAGKSILGCPTGGRLGFPLLFALALRLRQALPENGNQIDHLRRRLLRLCFFLDLFPARFHLLLDHFHEGIAVVVFVFLRV